MISQNQISFMGLDRAGKTVISNYLSSGVVNTDFRPTLSINYNTSIIQDIKYLFCDLPGQKKLRQTWIKVITTTKCLIFMIDTSDASRFFEAANEFEIILSRKTDKNTKILFLYHKIDLPKAKENLEEAKLFFNVEFFLEFGFKNVKFFETSIYNEESLDMVLKDITQ
jgi:GTP-binding protein SAR1